MATRPRMGTKCSSCPLCFLMCSSGGTNNPTEVCEFSHHSHRSNHPTERKGCHAGCYMDSGVATFNLFSKLCDMDWKLIRNRNKFTPNTLHPSVCSTPGCSRRLRRPNKQWRDLGARGGQNKAIRWQNCFPDKASAVVRLFAQVVCIKSRSSAAKMVSLVSRTTARTYRSTWSGSEVKYVTGVRSRLQMLVRGCMDHLSLSYWKSTCVSKKTDYVLTGSRWAQDLRMRSDKVADRGDCFSSPRGTCLFLIFLETVV